jgi:hypothetical protein
VNFTLVSVVVILALFGLMLAVQEWGRRLGERQRRADPTDERRGYGASEGAVFALLSLFLAFTFSGAGSRFDARRHLIVQEANAIGTAWLRIDLLPAAARPAVRDLVREYLDARLEIYRLVAAGEPYRGALEKSGSLQQQIWSASVDAAEKSGQVAPFAVLLPALNEMIDITTTRTAATRVHPPMVIYVLIGLLATVAAAFVGHGMAGRPARSVIHTLGFAAATALAIYVILDLEFPRMGFIRVDSADQVLVELRNSMR